MAGTKVRGITIELSADASGVQDALKQVNSSLRTTQSDLRDIEKLLKLDPTNTELLAQKQDALKKAIEGTKDKVEILRQAEEDLAKQMVDGGTEEQQRQLDALRREIVSTEADMKKYEGQLEDTGKATKDVAEDTQNAERHTSSFGETAKKAGAIAAAGFAAIAAAMVAVIKGLGDLITETAEYGDNVDKMSQKMGITAEAYQEWDFIMQHCGTSMDSLKSSMKTLATAAETGNAAFEKIGLSQEQIANMSQEDLFAATIAGLQGIDDTTERTYLASQLLGRGATELGALLNMSAEETAKMRDRVHELGGVMSDEGVKASAQFEDSLKDLQTAFSGVKRSLAGQFLPSVTKAMDGFTEILIGNTDEGIAAIKEGTDEMIQVLNEMLPTFIEVGGEVIVNLLTGIVENLPNLIPAIIDVVLKIVDTLIENLPLIIDAAIQIIIAIIKGIAEALPDLIPKIVEVVLTIVETLIDNIDLLIEAAVQLIVALAIGLVKAIPVLIEKAPEIIAGIVTGLAEGVWEMIQAGWDLIKGLWEGIKQGAVWLWEKVKGWLSDLWNGIKDFFSISSPSKEMMWLGKMLTEGLAEGIEDNADNAINAATDMAQGILGAVEAVDGTTVGINAAVNGTTGAGLAGSADTASGNISTQNNEFTINVYGSEGQNVNVLADEVIDRIQRTIIRTEAVYA